MRTTSLLALAVTLTFPQVLFAVPMELTLHGFITHEEGGSPSPVEGDLSITFRLYDGASAASSFWAETLLISVHGGHFSVVLGLSSPLDETDLVATREPRLGLSVATEPELTPRLPVTSVPYAITASTARVSTGVDCLGCIPPTALAFGYAGSNSAAGPAADLDCPSGCIESIELTNGAVTPAKLAPCAANQIMRFGAAGWSCTGTLFVIDDSGRVGIGTASPSVALDLGARSDALRLPNGNNAQRPMAGAGALRYNSESGAIELSVDGLWLRQEPLFVGGSGLTREVFTFTGADQNWVVPAGVTKIYAKLWGAGGAGGTPGGWSYGAPGGGGGHARGLIPVTPGETIRVVVGQMGHVNQSAGYGYGGGASGTINNTDNRYGGGGGGLTAIFRGSTPLLIAGGGGGGGSSRAWTGNAGGAGGGLAGQHGESPYDGKYGYGGGGGTQSAGGTSTGGENGTQYQGGHCLSNSYGGGGGGGYWGGAGGGYSESNTMAGGGGGSGYIGPTVRYGTTLAGSFQIPALVHDPDFLVSGAGATLHAHGGSPYGGGGHGFAVVYY